MQQRFELRRHHQVHQEDGQAESEQQRAHRFGQFLALPADMHAYACTQRLLGHHVADFTDRATQIDAIQVGRDDGHAHLVGAVDLAGAYRGHHVSHRFQAHGTRTARIDNQLADAFHRSAIRLLCTHQHVDLAVAEAVARGHVAAYFLHHHVGNLARGQAQRTSAVLVEADLDFREALFHR